MRTRIPVGREPRRTKSVATSLRGDRAGFEPRLGSGSAHESSRPQTAGSKQLSVNANPTPRLKSGAESRLVIAAILCAPRFSPYQRWAPIPRRTAAEQHLT